jgi:hypothetical protein
MVAQLIEADAAAAADDNMHEAVTSVDLSGNSSISAAIVARLLELHPNIATLTLFHTSSNLPLQDLSKVLTGKSGVELHHSELFSATFVDAKSRAWGDEPYQGRLTSVPNYAAPAARTVDRVHFLSIMRDIPKEDHSLRLPGGGLKWSELLSRDEFGFRSLVDRENPFFHTSIPLQDAFLNPVRLATWLPRLLWYFATNSATNDKRSCRDGHASLGCACALALDTEVS